MISKKSTLLYFLFLFSIYSFSQEKFTISGIIKDANSNETIIGVNVSIPELKTGITTNEYGFYSLTLPKGEYNIVISYVGFSTLTEKIVLTQNIKKNYSLTETGQQLDEVLITTDKKRLTFENPK